MLGIIDFIDSSPSELTLMWLLLLWLTYEALFFFPLYAITVEIKKTGKIIKIRIRRWKIY